MNIKSIFIDLIDRSYSDIPKAYSLFFKEDFIFGKKRLRNNAF